MPPGVPPPLPPSPRGQLASSDPSGLPLPPTPPGGDAISSLGWGLDLVPARSTDPEPKCQHTPVGQRKNAASVISMPL